MIELYQKYCSTNDKTRQTFVKAARNDLAAAISRS